MTNADRACDAASCDRAATGVEQVDLPDRSVVLRLCDEHTRQLHDGQIRQIRQDRGDGGEWDRAIALFRE